MDCVKEVSTCFQQSRNILFIERLGDYFFEKLRANNPLGYFNINSVTRWGIFFFGLEDGWLSTNWKKKSMKEWIGK